MVKFAVFTDEGFPTAFYSKEIHGNDIPTDAIEITDNQWQEFIDNQGMRKWLDGQIVEHVPSTVDPVTIVPSFAFWERLTEKEADDVRMAMSTKPFRTQQIFLTANTFRSDHELWPLLKSMATELFGEERASELLKP